jgi:hypothetical protein
VLGISGVTDSPLASQGLSYFEFIIIIIIIVSDMNSESFTQNIISLNATVFTFISPAYDTFRPQTAIIRCFVYDKTVPLYKI